jgi:hypothetical protein
MKREQILLQIAERLCNKIEDLPAWVNDEPIKSYTQHKEKVIQDNSPSRYYWNSYE